MADPGGQREPSDPQAPRGVVLSQLPRARRLAERALVAVIQEAYVHGVSTRKVDELVQALGLGGTSKSAVSRICAEIDAQVQASEIARWRAVIRTCGWMRKM